jgi:HSP20 family molecular chaperone IbpA
MAFMRPVGTGHHRPTHASVREDGDEYVIELDVADFGESELVVEMLGRRLTVRAEQVEVAEDDGKAFRLHERLEESFRLPDEVDPEDLRVFFARGTLEIHAPRTRLEPRELPIEHPSHRHNPNAVPC